MIHQGILIRTVWLLLVVAETTFAADAATTPQPFFETYCIRCHGANKQEGRFRLDALSPDMTDEPTAQKWSEVLFRIHSGEMPPKTEKQPTAQELGQTADWISTRIKEGAAVRMAKRGPVAYYRLSREEYANTVYDLLGVYFDVELPGAFHEDPRWHGFERIGSMLSLSPSHVDRYFRAAETVLERAFPEQQPQSRLLKADSIQLRHHQDRQKFEAAGFAPKIRDLIWPGGSLPGFRPWFFGNVQDSGVYRARIKLSGLPGMDGRAPHLSVWNSNLKKSIFDEDIIAPENKPIVVEFETFLSMPVDIELLNELPGAFNKSGNHTLNILNLANNVFLGSRDFSRTNPTGYKLFDDAGQAIYPTLIVDSVEWEGPLVSQADLKKRAGLIPTKPDDANEVRECLRRLATRAWRHPAQDQQIDRYLVLLKRELEAGEPFPSAYRAAMVAILTSKNFLYLEEGSAEQRRERVDDWELASRLSYFLWGSMPDEELFAAAQAGTLHQPESLRAQAARLADDPKIKRFLDSFPRQWLQLHRIGMFPPDPSLYPDYDLWLQKSLALEPAMYFSELFSRNLPVREFLASDWAMVNPRLAQHYGLNPLPGFGFQRVALRPDDHRGGLLTQAGVLMLTSDGTRHRPVHRGVWVSEAIYGRTPPPPPPNVEPLAPTPSDKPKATIRMQLAAHATHAICASCHRKIDPLGFAFENYDAIGRWRTVETVSAGQGENPPVDSQGKLPDGRAFANAAEFQQLLAQDIDQFAAAFVEQLATYALRRVMTADDQAAIRSVAKASQKDGYRLRTIIENLIMSDLFQKR